MAITNTERWIFNTLRDQGELEAQASVLEFGENNWYGDIPLLTLRGDIETLVLEESHRLALLARVDAVATRLQEDSSLYEIAKIFFQAHAGSDALDSIDIGAADVSHRLDLNVPINISKRYDIVLNAGTLEHIFNVGEVFRSAHQLVRAGGLMIHTCPFTGWVDHGFYNINPTLFWDVAEANGYDFLLLAITTLSPFTTQVISFREEVSRLALEGSLPAISSVCAVFRKPVVARDFVILTQGIYTPNVSGEVRRAWHILR